VIAGVLLAAGAARRYGASKLTVLHAGLPLVRHAALALVSVADIHGLWVVVGANAERVREALAEIDVRFVDHVGYMDGIGSSIAAGIQSLPRDCEGAVIALGDQPSIPATVLQSLLATWRTTGAAIVAPRYRGVVANPVLFARSVFPELSALRGDAGARSVVMREPERVHWLEFDLPVPVDVDTPDDLNRL
jgi:molybdenum cofactor cytidylyltransferase